MERTITLFEYLKRRKNLKLGQVKRGKTTFTAYSNNLTGIDPSMAVHVSPPSYRLLSKSSKQALFLGRRLIAYEDEREAFVKPYESIADFQRAWDFIGKYKMFPHAYLGMVPELEMKKR